MSQNYDPNQPGQPYYDSLMTPKSEPPDLKLEPPASGIFAKWMKVITRPSVATFASEAPDANWGTVFLGVLIYGVAYFLIVLIGVALIAGSSLGSVLGLIFQFTIYAVIGSVIGLVIGSGFLYLMAKTVGQGQGDFTTQTYLYSLYTFPIAIISSILTLIPVIGPIVSLALSIYALFLAYYMLQAAHRMSANNARNVILLTIIIGLVLVILLFVVFGGLILNLMTGRYY